MNRLKRPSRRGIVVFWLAVRVRVSLSATRSKANDVVDAVLIHSLRLRQQCNCHVLDTQPLSDPAKSADFLSRWFQNDFYLIRGFSKEFKESIIDFNENYILNYNLNSIRFEWMKLTFNGLYLAKYGYLNYKIESFPLNNLTPECVHSASNKRL